MAKASSKAPKKPAAETPAQPYYLQKARVKDYRSVRDAEVEFKPGLNIIIGANGSGKTNFLRAIENSLQSTSEIQGKANSEFELGGRNQLKITYHKRKPQLDNRFAFNPAITLEAELTLGSHTVREESLSLAFEKLVIGKRWGIISINQGIFAQDPLLLDVSLDASVEANGAGFAGGETTHFVESFISSFTEEIYEKTQFAKQPFAFTLSFVKEIVLKHCDRYITTLNEKLPVYTKIQRVRLNNTIQFYFNEIQNEVLIRNLNFEYNSNGAWLPFKLLSDGTRRMICVISALIAPESFYDEKLPKDKIFLLEEPELGIHPHQLHLLLNLIREVSDKHQVIMTTHSPQVLDMLKTDELDRILICELKDPKKGTQFRRLTAEQQEHARRYMREVGFLSDYWRLEDLDGVAANDAQ